MRKTHKISKIVSHPGPGHRDDFMAVCLLLAVADWPGPRIFRREPTQEDIDDPTVAVVDVGRRHMPERLNFDHHQFGRGTVCCAVDLVLQWLGYQPEVYREIFAWAEFTSRLDSTGPKATAEWLGITSDGLLKTISPIETSLIRWWSDMSTGVPETALFDVMERIGKEKLDYIEKVQTRLVQLEKAPLVDLDVVTSRTLSSLLDLRHISRDADPIMGVEIFLKRKGLDKTVFVTVSQDQRGEGVSLFRRNDDPRIDFGHLRGHPDISFVHATGFVATTTKEGADRWLELVQEAYKKTVALRGRTA